MLAPPWYHVATRFRSRWRSARTRCRTRTAAPPAGPGGEPGARPGTTVARCGRPWGRRPVGVRRPGPPQEGLREGDASVHPDVATGLALQPGHVVLNAVVHGRRTRPRDRQRGGRERPPADARPRRVPGTAAPPSGALLERRHPVDIPSMPAPLALEPSGRCGSSWRAARSEPPGSAQTADFS